MSVSTTRNSFEGRCSQSAQDNDGYSLLGVVEGTDRSKFECLSQFN
jgi:hypothetical protein